MLNREEPTKSQTTLVFPGRGRLSPQPMTKATKNN